MSEAFLFGKLPAHGDFVARGIAADARDQLDLWLAGSLAEARLALGDDFDERYEAAPPWRFAWGADDGWTAGAMALSVDGVGRRYPILAGFSGLAAADVEGAADGSEDLLYAALGDGWDADRLHAALAGATLAPLGAWEGGDGWWTLGSDPFNETYLRGRRPAGLMTAVLTPGAEEARGGVDGGRDDA